MRGCQLRMRFERSLISSSRTVVLDEIRATISSSSTVVDPKIRATISARAEVCSEARKARKALASLLAALKLRARIALVTFLWAGRYLAMAPNRERTPRAWQSGAVSYFLRLRALSLIADSASSRSSSRRECLRALRHLSAFTRGSRWWAFPRLGAVSILPESVRAARRLASCGAIA